MRTGRLGAFRREEGQEPQFLGVIRPGEPAGEMALIAGIPHSADVYALRDSEIFAMPKDAFFEACDADASVMTELARLMILRSRQAARRGPVGEPSVFGFVAVGQPGRRCARWWSGWSARSPPWATTVTTVGRGGRRGAHRVVLRGRARPRLRPLRRRARRAGLGALRAAPGGPAVPRRPRRPARRGRRAARPAPAPLQDQRLVDLILVQPAEPQRPAGSEAWLDATSAARVFHLRRGHAPDFERMARVLTGQSVGLVLSGGGARAYAHVGAIKALRERGVPIDFVGGSSMGAIVAAGLAMGWGDERDGPPPARGLRQHQPAGRHRPAAAGHDPRREGRPSGCTHHFGDTQIADLWLPFFCLSSNLTTGAYQLHRRGLAAPRAARLHRPARRDAAGHRRQERAGGRGGDEELPGRHHARRRSWGRSSASTSPPRAASPPRTWRGPRRSGAGSARASGGWARRSSRC